MPAAVPIIYGVMAAATVASTAYTVSESNSAKKDANRVAEEQKAAQAKAESELKAQQSAADAKEANLVARNTAQARKRNASGFASRGTILTSPLGVPGTANTSQKTLLGM